jgi:hypothetical protein
MAIPDSMHLYDRLIPELPKKQHTSRLILSVGVIRIRLNNTAMIFQV